MAKLNSGTRIYGTATVDSTLTVAAGIQALSVLIGGSNDLTLTRRAAASLQLGAADAAAPVAQTLSVQGVVAGTTNIAGTNFTINGSQGTGTGVGGSLIFQVAPAGSSGSAQNALATAFRVVPGTPSGGTTTSSYIIIGSNSNSFICSPFNYGIELNCRNNNGYAVALNGGATGAFIGESGPLGWSSTISQTGRDLFLYRDAANTLALRNSTAAQTFNVYNTWSSATNYERFTINAQSAAAVLIGTNKGSGGGTARALELQTDATTRLAIDTSGNVGIGTSSPNSKLAVLGSDGTGFTGITSVNSNVNVGIAGVQFGSDPTYVKAAIGLLRSSPNGVGSLVFYNDSNTDAANWATTDEKMRIDNSGNVGIGTTSPSYQLHVNTDSAGKPGAGGLWTVVSDERIKSNIVPANLDRCYEIVKSVPLKYFGFAPGVYTDDQINDKHNLGWIAQDVQRVFKNAVSVKPFTLKTDIPDGVEEYEEQDFTTETVEKTETSIQVIDGKAVQVSKVVASENKVMLFDTVDVLDEAGDAVMDGDKPLTYQIPRMITKTRPKVRHDVIEDCLDLNGGQMIAALYGAVQSLMATVETQAARITQLERA